MLVATLNIQVTATTPRSDVVQIVAALNMCLPFPNQFQIGRQNCSGEFLDFLLNSLCINRFFSVFQETGQCSFCGVSQNSQLQNTTSPYLLLFAVQSQIGPIDLSQVVANVMNQPGQNFACQTAGCPGHGCLIASRVECLQGQASVYWIARNTTNTKTLTPLNHPGQSNLWGQKLCVMVLGHCGRIAGAGHWILFVLESTCLASPRIENPFTTQLKPGNAHSADDFTIDLLFFG